MNTILVIGVRTELVERMRRLFPECSFFSLSEQETPELLPFLPADVVVAEVSGKGGPDLIRRIRRLQPQSVLVGLLPQIEFPEEKLELIWERCDFALREPCSSIELKGVLTQALNKRCLVQELNRLQEKVSGEAVQEAIIESTPSALERTLDSLAKFLSSGFNLDRLLDQFLETVTEMVHPSRASILIFDQRSSKFQVRVHRGLPSRLVDELKLSSQGGLALYLAREGCIVQRHQGKPPEVEAELEALQANLAVPLVARGRLVGIMCLGQRITGQPYTPRELEILFTMASHVGVAVQDFQFYHQVQYQKQYIENILIYMSSGVITIDQEEKVTIFNYQAGKILGLKPSEVLNQDLRSLPSPLGDLLFETLKTGKSYRRHEVQILPKRLPLEVNTYQLTGEEGEVVGSVMLLDDISWRRELEEERLRAERLDILNRVAGWVAHEIKNPLVSIRTMVELLPDRYGDSEFRDQFGSVVGQEVKNLDEMVEKLVSLTDVAEYRYQQGDIIPLIEQCVSELRERGLLAEREIFTRYQEGTPPVKHDPEQLKRALFCLLSYLLKFTPSGSRLSIWVGPLRGKLNGAPSLRVKISVPALEFPPERFHRFFTSFDIESAPELGICVSQRIVSEHGGWITVERDKRGKEMVFSVHLPLER